MAPPASSNPSGKTTFDASLFEVLSKAEDHHFWFRARNEIIEAVCRRIVESFQPGYRVLEVGCGTGNVLRYVERACAGGSVVGLDLYAEGLQIARGRTRCALVRGDLRGAPFALPFDLIGLFDVLEHIPDDGQVLRDLFGLLRPGGTLFLTVPAHPMLWSYSDVVAHHCRRYTESGLINKLTSAGFQVRFRSPYMGCLLPLVWISRLRPGLGRVEDMSEERKRQLFEKDCKIRPGINRALYYLLSIEKWFLARRKRLLAGTSYLMIAEKPE